MRSRRLRPALPDPAQATAIRYIGIGVKGVFCAETQPDRAFTHFHMYEAAEYAEGYDRQPGDQGYWLMSVATETFDTRDGRHVTPGVDRQFSPTPPPECGSAASPAAFPRAGASVEVTGHEYHFAPAELRARAGAAISVTFTNAGSIPHTLTVPAVHPDTGSVAAGNSATINFTAPPEQGSTSSSVPSAAMRRLE